MKSKFSKIERVAGLFVAVAIIGFLAATLGVAVKKGWFASKVHLVTVMTTADGVHPGTPVQMSGVHAGSVDDIELISASEVRIHFNVLDRFAGQIKQDSVVQFIRPFIIGDKVLDISIGSTDQPVVADGAQIAHKETFDIMDLLSGRKMNAFATSFDRMAESIRIFAEAFADPERSKALVSMVDRMGPLIKNLNTMSVQVTKVTDSALKEKRLETMMENLAEMSKDMNELLPAFTEEAPDMGHQMGQIVKNLNVLTTELNKLTPAINELAPDLPKTTKRAVEALDETVVLLKAMQRSWFFRGNVKDIRQEEEKAREPAEN